MKEFEARVLADQRERDAKVEEEKQAYKAQLDRAHQRKMASLKQLEQTLRLQSEKYEAQLREQYAQVRFEVSWVCKKNSSYGWIGIGVGHSLLGRKEGRVTGL